MNHAILQPPSKDLFDLMRGHRDDPGPKSIPIMVERNNNEPMKLFELSSSPPETADAYYQLHAQPPPSAVVIVPDKPRKKTSIFNKKKKVLHQALTHYEAFRKIII